jgi:hypothetical protein
MKGVKQRHSPFTCMKTSDNNQPNQYMGSLHYQYTMKKDKNIG